MVQYYPLYPDRRVAMNRTVVVTSLVVGVVLETLLRAVFVLVFVCSIIGLFALMMVEPDSQDLIDILTPALLKPLQKQLAETQQSNDNLSRKQRQQLAFERVQHEQRMRQLEERRNLFDSINQTHQELGLPPLQDPDLLR